MATDQQASFHFSADLPKLAGEHVQFLKMLHSHGISISRPSQESLRRYRDLWLSLVYEHPDVPLVPPADIAWLWHCHRLAPYRYVSYLKSKFGLECPILEANPPFALQLHETAEKSETLSLWMQKYPNEPYLLSASPQYVEKKSTDEGLLLDGFDLLGSTDRQATFLWQVSGPRFADHDFLQRGLENYYKFLQLRKLAPPKQIIVPTYQIDLLWHTHILSSLKGYYQDCQAIMGTTLHHDDSLNNRTEGGTLDTAFRQTKALWKQQYGQDYHVPGGMYRGEPPQEYYSIYWGLSQLDFELPPAMPLFWGQLVGVQGASSTTPTTEACDMRIHWCWKETPDQMSNHPSSKVVGDPANCWIQYDNLANNSLEAAFQVQGGSGACAAIYGYTVDFDTMKQTNISTGYNREIQRVIETDTVAFAVATLIDSTLVTSVTSATSVTWCWKETLRQMDSHQSTSIVGNASDCWVKYDATVNLVLESAYQSGDGALTLLSGGYSVNFGTMKQTNVSTGYIRTIQRVIGNNTTPKVWCWKEEQGQISNQSTSRIVGDPSDCWIRYGVADNDKLEITYQQQGGTGDCSPITINGYIVNFDSMKQTKTSTGYQRDVQRIDDDISNDRSGSSQEWTPLNGITANSMPAFIAAVGKSTVRGVNANLKKDDYIFGDGPYKRGYYHVTTKEAYQILLTRVRSRVIALEQNLECSICCYTIFTLGLRGKPQCVTDQEEALDELQVTREVIAARATASKRSGIVGIPAGIQNDKRRVQQYYSDTGAWYFPTACYDAGGGCGTCGVSGGGCGGGACGAGACGGGGCGGGGGGCGG